MLKVTRHGICIEMSRVCPDGICIEMLKVTRHETLPYLITLFNDIFKNGTLPTDWCKSILCPIYKNGYKASPEHYRGISLINSVCKIFNGVLTTRLQKLECTESGFR